MVARSSIGVAVIGAGMAGRAHAAGYRSATTVYEAGLPEVRLVAIADVNVAFASDAAQRFGYERAESGWEAIAAASDVDAVSVVVTNPLHREIVEGLLAAGKHVLCEKPLAPSVEDAEAMVAAAKASQQQTAVGFVFRRSPAIAAIREQVEHGGIGRPVHFNGHYWCDYGCDPSGPMSRRYKGGAGSGALADIGSHLLDLAEFVCGPIESVRGAVLSTFITERALPLGTAVGHAAAAVSDVREPVENEDLVTFTARFASGATGTFSASRVAYGLPNALGFELFTESGAATFDLARLGEFGFADPTPPGVTQGYRQVLAGPCTRTWPRGCRWTSPASATGRTTCSPSRPGRSWSRSPGWAGCPARRRSKRACTTSACWTRSSPRPRPAARKWPSTRPHTPWKEPDPREAWCLHRLPARQACRRGAPDPWRPGLDSAEINSGGFLPAPHLPIEQVRTSKDARDEYLELFSSAGVTLTALNCNGNPLDPNPEVGPRHAQDVRDAIELGALLGVKRVVTMSGLPAAEPGGRLPSWTVEPWHSVFLDARDYQWNEVAIPFWKDIQARAADADVKVCIEMHPHNVVYNPATMERLATEINATHVGAEMDPSHLFWQGIDPIAALDRLDGLVYNAAAKDTRINEAAKVNGVLDDRFGRVRPDDPGAVSLGGRYTLSRWPENSSWDFVAVGRGHDVAFWSEFLKALNKIDPNMAVNIEHEDQELDQMEGLPYAAETLLDASSRIG